MLNSVIFTMLCSIFMQARDLEDPVYLDAINSLLISGEYPHLFTNDEMEGLLQVLITFIIVFPM